MRLNKNLISRIVGYMAFVFAVALVAGCSSTDKDSDGETDSNDLHYTVSSSVNFSDGISKGEFENQYPIAVQTSGDIVVYYKAQLVKFDANEVVDEMIGSVKSDESGSAKLKIEWPKTTFSNLECHIIYEIRIFIYDNETRDKANVSETYKTNKKDSGCGNASDGSVTGGSSVSESCSTTGFDVNNAANLHPDATRGSLFDTSIQVNTSSGQQTRQLTGFLYVDSVKDKANMVKCTDFCSGALRGESAFDKSYDSQQGESVSTNEVNKFYRAVVAAALSTQCKTLSIGTLSGTRTTILENISGFTKSLAGYHDNIEWDQTQKPSGSGQGRQLCVCKKQS